MLVLSRRIHEEVVIGPDIVVTVLKVEGNRVRLGFSAPDGVSIQREELLCRLGIPLAPHAIDDPAAVAPRQPR
jgi:carbon storage regulator CsrA